MLNSVVEILEDADIPFSWFHCKRDDPELSNFHKILTTVAYHFAEHYHDYRSLLADLVDQSRVRSLLAGDVKEQSELLFGETCELNS